MRMVKDYGGGDVIVRDYPVEADTYAQGEVLALGLSDGNDLGFAKSGEGALRTGADVILGIGTEEWATSDGMDIDDRATFISSHFIHPLRNHQ